MNIAKDSVVQFNYNLKDDQGNDIETTTGGEPMAYLHGHGNIIPGLEQALEGKAVGERKENAQQRIPLKHLQGARKWKPGMMAVVETEQGYRQVTVVKVGKFNADVDTNHPLAGKTLVFDIDVVDVREATAEEKAHGHAHGVGGHHH